MKKWTLAEIKQALKELSEKGWIKSKRVPKALPTPRFGKSLAIPTQSFLQ